MIEDNITLIVGGQEYYGWNKLRLTRAIEHCSSDFDIEVTERWAGHDRPWQIKPFSPCVVRVGDTTVLTGYIDQYNPAYDDKSHTVHVSGRSKTEDLIDCCPESGTGQFAGYRLDQVARALCNLSAALTSSAPMLAVRRPSM